MQISLKWINELIKIESINLNELIEKLTLGGFEVDDIIEIEINNEKTITLEISTTANRSDSLSIQGFSLEIAALLNSLPNISNYSTTICNWSKQINNLPINILENQECLQFISLTVQGLNNSLAPKWLRQKLIASGMPIQNNLLDFQNYILLETGYPLEFYDLNKIYSKINLSKFNLSLVKTSNISNIKFNSSNYEITEPVSILKANDFPIGIAGIIPNQAVQISNTTESLLIEGSIFTAANIRKQSRILGIRTDRSSRYEKSVKKTNVLESIYRLICLLKLINPDLIVKIHTITNSLEKITPIILLNYENIKKILGPVKSVEKNNEYYILPELVTNLLNRLQFNNKYDKEKFQWEVKIPFIRSDDIHLEIDLIEEIGRLYGFNNFLIRLPNIKTIGTEDFNYQTRKKLTTCLINLGLNELIQYSLVNQNTYLRNKIKLINPLTNEYSNLRTSLLPNLLKALAENFKNSNLILEGFEYGHIFSEDNLNSIIELECIAGIFGSNKQRLIWPISSKFLTWFEAKGKLEQLLKKLNILAYWKLYLPLKEKTIVHPYCTSKLYLTNGEKLGIFGQINPIIAKQLNIESDIYLFELNFELIKTQIQINKSVIYQEYYAYPKIIKDLSFIINKDISFDKIKKSLYLNGSKFLQTINLLDEYRGKSISEDSTSLCLQLIFYSNQKTLKNVKIEKILNNLKNILIHKFGAIIRS